MAFMASNSLGRFKIEHLKTSPLLLPYLTFSKGSGELQSPPHRFNDYKPYNGKPDNPYRGVGAPRLSQ